ncbi:MAG: cytochrome c [Aureispira sp.]|nr:cytochrome c [Aureispira sp.]
MFKVAVFSTILLLLSACSGNNSNSNSPKEISGYEIFRMQCVACHGQDGKLGLNGAQDLTQSTFTAEERIEILSNGKGVMPSFRGILSQDEIKAVVDYTFKLKEE